MSVNGIFWSDLALDSICCGKPKPTMSPLRKQGSIAKKLDSRSFDLAQDEFRGNDKRDKAQAKQLKNDSRK